MKFAILNTCKSHLIFQTEKYLKKGEGFTKISSLVSTAKRRVFGLEEI